MIAVPLDLQDLRDPLHRHGEACSDLVNIGIIRAGIISMTAAKAHQAFVADAAARAAIVLLSLDTRNEFLMPRVGIWTLAPTVPRRGIHATNRRLK